MTTNNWDDLAEIVAGIDPDKVSKKDDPCPIATGLAAKTMEPQDLERLNHGVLFDLEGVEGIPILDTTK